MIDWTCNAAQHEKRVVAWLRVGRSKEWVGRVEGFVSTLDAVVPVELIRPGLCEYLNSAKAHLVKLR